MAEPDRAIWICEGGRVAGLVFGADMAGVVDKNRLVEPAWLHLYST
jgi:hypothetical protein